LREISNRLTPLRGARPAMPAEIPSRNAGSKANIKQGPRERWRPPPKFTMAGNWPWKRGRRNILAITGNHDSMFAAVGLCTAYHIPRESGPVPRRAPLGYGPVEPYTDPLALSSLGLSFRDHCVALTGLSVPDRAKDSTAGLHTMKQREMTPRPQACGVHM
jgi:hypothetical protein